MALFDGRHGRGRRTALAAAPSSSSSSFTLRAAVALGVASTVATAVTVTVGPLVLRRQAAVARRRIGKPLGENAIDADRLWQRSRGGRPVRLIMLGDSLAAGLGAQHRKQTLGARIAKGMAHHLQRPVRLRTGAVVGAESSTLDTQIDELGDDARADVAVIIVGGNDVTHRVSAGDAARSLAGAIDRLQRLGCAVVVGTCPDLSALRPVPQPLRGLIGRASRQLAEAQEQVTDAAGAHAVSLRRAVGPLFVGRPDEMFSLDRFHPSALGYRRTAEAIVPAVVRALALPPARRVRLAEPMADATPDATPHPTPDAWRRTDAYLARTLVGSDPDLDAARADQQAAGMPDIEVAPLNGKLLNLLARITGARRVLEIGTLGGYSTIWLARALPHDGRVVTIEAEPHHAEVARRSIERAGLGDRVEIRVGRAVDVLPELEGPFDLVFIDADKESSTLYLDAAARLGRPGSVVVVDNIGRAGRIADPASENPQVIGTQRGLEMLARDPRFDATALQTLDAKGWDGIALAVLVDPDDA